MWVGFELVETGLIMASSTLRLVVFGLLVAASFAQFTVVNISGLGSVQGLYEPRGLTFLGVPYARK